MMRYLVEVNKSTGKPQIAAGQRTNVTWGTWRYLRKLINENFDLMVDYLIASDTSSVKMACLNVITMR